MSVARSPKLKTLVYFCPNFYRIVIGEQDSIDKRDEGTLTT